MNTDNMSIAGETIDYGPCAFMDAYRPGDGLQLHRPAWAATPTATSRASPNGTSTRLAETLLPLLAEDQDAGLAEAQEALGAFAARFETRLRRGFRRKLGLLTERDDDSALAQDLLELMARNGADFTLTFRRLCDAAVGAAGDAAVRSLFADPSAYDGWAARWRHRLARAAEGRERRTAMRASIPSLFRATIWWRR